MSSAFTGFALVLLLAGRGFSRLESADWKSPFLAKGYENDLSRCNELISKKIPKAKKEWGNFDFRCDNGHVEWLVFLKSGRIYSDWSAFLRKEHGILGATEIRSELVKDSYAQLVLPQQSWKGIPIGIGPMGAFDVYPDSVAFVITAADTTAWTLDLHPRLSKDQAIAIGKSYRKAGPSSAPFNKVSLFIAPPNSNSSSLVDGERDITVHDCGLGHDPKLIWNVSDDRSYHVTQVDAKSGEICFESGTRFRD